MASLVPCPECGTFLRVGDSRCPSCAATIGERTVSVRAAGAMIAMGLALTGCPDRSTGDTAGTAGSEGSATTATESSTMSDTGSATASGSEASSDGEASTWAEAGPAYGVAVATTDWDASSSSGDQTATDTDVTATGTDSTGDTGIVTSGTGPQPLYGVVESD